MGSSFLPYNVSLFMTAVRGFAVVICRNPASPLSQVHDSSLAGPAAIPRPKAHRHEMTFSDSHGEAMGLPDCVGKAQHERLIAWQKTRNEF